MKLYVEGYGCSMNLAETEQIKGHAAAGGIEISNEVSASDFLVINTCAVKGKTESRMLARIKKLNATAEKGGKQLVVFGCLPKVNPEAIAKISPGIIQLGPELAKLCAVLGISQEEFSPQIEPMNFNELVTIVPIAAGCTNFCTFCGTKLARGNIRSYDPAAIKKRIENSLSRSKEFWLTGQDTGAYGVDIQTSLPALVRDILSIKADFRLRIGMMNPHHLRRIYDDLVGVFSDPRVYKFLHVPVQSGSDSVLRHMRRGYTASQYIELIEKLKRDVPGITIATDLIAGYPTETEEDFNDTLRLVQQTAPELVNVSRFAPRPGTLAAALPQLAGSVIKSRSTRLAALCRAVSLKTNEALVGTIAEAFFTEKGKNNTFVGKIPNYRTVVVEENLIGRFAQVQITQAHPYWLGAKIISAQKAEGKNEMPIQTVNAESCSTSDGSQELVLSFASRKA